MAINGTIDGTVERTTGVPTAEGSVQGSLHGPISIPSPQSGPIPKGLALSIAHVPPVYFLICIYIIVTLHAFVTSLNLSGGEI